MFLEIDRNAGGKLLLNLGHVRYITKEKDGVSIYCVSFKDNTDFIVKSTMSYEDLKSKIDDQRLILKEREE